MIFFTDGISVSPLRYEMMTKCKITAKHFIYQVVGENQKIFVQGVYVEIFCHFTVVTNILDVINTFESLRRRGKGLTFEGNIHSSKGKLQKNRLGYPSSLAR